MYLARDPAPTARPERSPVIRVRPELPADVAGIRALHLDAFSTPAEADLVDALRRGCPDFRSWVAATEDGALAGHVLYTPARADSGPHGLGLGPMAVATGRQNAGVGTALMEASLARLAADGAAWVVVLGHPRYYPRFGFRPARTYGLGCVWDAVPDPAFLVRELRPGDLEGVTRTIRYRPEFAALL